MFGGLGAVNTFSTYNGFLVLNPIVSQRESVISFTSFIYLKNSSGHLLAAGDTGERRSPSSWTPGYSRVLERWTRKQAIKVQ